jgi:hypothetical protein
VRKGVVSLFFIEEPQSKARQATVNLEDSDAGDADDRTQSKVLWIHGALSSLLYKPHKNIAALGRREQQIDW